MAKISSSILVRAPVSRVFGLMADGENASKWHSSVLEAKRIRGGKGVGSTVEYLAKVSIFKYRYVTEAVEWVDNAWFKDVLVESPSFRKYTVTGKFEERPEGTLVTLSIDYELKGRFMRFLDRILIRRRAQKRTAEALERVKRIFESER